jgi:CSLREA domain-containing protein
MSPPAPVRMIAAMTRRTGFLVALLTPLALAAPASATEIAVTTHADLVGADGRCSLREAVTAANTDAAFGDCPAGEPAAGDLVRLDAGLYLLSRAGTGEDANGSGDLDIAAGGPLTIAGQGASTTTISTAGIDRVLDVAAGATARAERLSVAFGVAPAGANSPDAAGGDGEHGGGIRNAGILDLVESAVTDNRAGNGGIGKPAGIGGDGGGIWSSGDLTVIDTTVSDNAAGQPGSVPFAGPTALPARPGADGGGILATGPLRLESSRVLRNTAGGGSLGGATIGTPVNGGDGGSGGGIHAAELVLRASTIAGNAAGAGAAGRSSIVDGGSGGPGGRGGGLLVSGPLTMAGTLVTDNAAGAGGSGSAAGPTGTPGNGGRGGSGGGLYAGGVATIVHSTLTGSVAGPGGAAGGAGGTAGGAGFGSAVSAGPDTTISRALIDGTCFGLIADGGLNLTSTGSPCPGTVGPLSLSPAGVPLAGSPAIDGGPAAGCPADDLLGTSRPQGAGCDIGAVEVPAAALTLSSGTLAFGASTLGAGAQTLAVTVGNAGLPGLALPIAVTGAPDFTIAGETCPDVLPAAASCAVTVAFAPAGAGARTGTLQLAGRSVDLTGTGVAPSGSPPKKCVVPKLKGKTVKAARRALVAANCRLGKVKRSGRGRVGRIRAFKPKAGSELAAGARVNVTVNRRRGR